MSRIGLRIRITFGSYVRQHHIKAKIFNFSIKLHKNLYFGDWNDTDTIPTLENLPNKMLVSDMQNLIIPSFDSVSQGTIVKDINKMGNKFRDPISNHSNLTLSIISISSQSPLDLVAVDQKTFDYWCDGIHALIRKEMKREKRSSPTFLTNNL